MTLSSPPRIVCFDLGGVVVRICRSFEEATLAAGVPLRRVPVDESARSRQRHLIAQHQLGSLDGRSFLASLAEALDHTFTVDELDRIHRAILRDEYPGIVETIAAINALGITTACLSNTNDDHWDELVTMPALRAMHALHASHLWGLAKPDAAIYRRFELERRASGREILFFDDLDENVTAALSLGWDAVRIDHTGDTAAQVREALATRGVDLSAAATAPSSRPG